MNSGKTSLNDDQYAQALEFILAYISKQGKITNKEVRLATQLNYDQVIKLFNRAIEEGKIERKGRASGTYYI